MNAVAGELFKGRSYKINARGRDRFEFLSPYSVEIKDLDGLQQRVQQEMNEARLKMIELTQCQQRLKQVMEEEQSAPAVQRPAPKPVSVQPAPVPQPPKLKTTPKPAPLVAAPEAAPKRRLSGKKYLAYLKSLQT